MKKKINKNLVTTVENKKSFKSSYKFWICGGLFAE